MIETYTDKHFLDVMKLIENFHKEAAGEYLGVFDPETTISTIKTITASRPDNVFLLILDGVCEGLLAGVEFPAMASDKRIFQEIIWYVNTPFRKHGIKLYKYAEKMLKERGISIMIMAVLENSKTKKIKSFYERIGYKPMEVHYMKEL